MRSLQYLAAVILLPLFLTGCPKKDDSVACQDFDGRAKCQAQSSNGVALAGHHDAADLAGKAASGIYMNATMATLGSFEWDVAPVTNHEADLLISIPLNLKSKAITKEQAQQTLDAVEKAHDLSEQALKTCNQDSHTGKCRGSEAKARVLLDQAKAQLAGL